MTPKFFRRMLFKCRPPEKWKAVRGYTNLHGLLRDQGLPARPTEFTTGPLRRFFDLALEPGLGASQRCRIVEHARHWAQLARDEFGDQNEALVSGIHDEIARLKALGAGGHWVAKVFKGDALHHSAPAFPDEDRAGTRDNG